MAKKRLVGVTVLGWLNVVVGTLGILAFLLKSPGIMFGASLLLVTGIGLLKLREWARILEIILVLGGVLFQIVKYVSSILHYAVPLNEAWIFFLKGNIFGWIIAGIIIYFFTRPKVKEQFKR